MLNASLIKFLPSHCLQELLLQLLLLVSFVVTICWSMAPPKNSTNFKFHLSFLEMVGLPHWVQLRP
jgi:hypothetical protein